MKTIPAGLLAHYQQPTTTVATFLRVVRADEATFGFTTTDRVITVDGLAYEPGFEVSAIASSEALNVDNLELTILPDRAGGTITALDLLTGKWDNAFFEIFEANYEAPADGINVLKRGWTGNVTVRNGSYVIEFRSLAQRLQQAQGIVSSKNCRSQLGDAKCRVDLADFTVTGTATAVASARVFTDSARTEADDWYGEGSVTFTSGANAGYTRKCKTYVADVFELVEAFPFPIEIGDAYEAVAGCRKRHERSLANPTGESDCVDKFDNILNFQGEPHLQGVDALTRPATASAQP